MANSPKSTVLLKHHLKQLKLPTMFAVGWLAFGESVGPLQFFAGALVVGAIFLVPRPTHN